MSKIAKEIAVEEIERFMKSFNLDPIKKRKIEETINSCIEFIEEGLLIVTEEDTLKYTLLEPICDDKGKILCDSVEFKNKRVRVEEVKELSTIIEETEQFKKLISKLTDMNSAFVSKLTLDDLSYLTTITAFFMPA